MLLIATVAFAVMRWFSVDPRTRAGQDAFFDVKRRSRRLRGASTTDEVGMAVAIYGTSVRVGSGWADFHRMRGGDSDGGGSGGGGDSGCGGGGCGGCGS